MKETQVSRMKTYSTQTVPSRQRFSFWRQLISSTVMPLRIEDGSDGGFFGSLSTCEVGSSRLVCVRSTSQYILRTAGCIGTGHQGAYLLNYLVRGRGFNSQHGNFHPIEAGNFFFHDSNAIGDLRMAGEFEILTLALPRALVGRYFACAPAACAVPLSIEQSAVAQMAADVLQTLARDCTGADHDCLEASITSLVRMLSLAYRIGPNTSTTNSALLVRIRDYILAHLADENLTPSRVAFAHGISERYLSKLFEIDRTTVSRWIWAQRLEASRKALAAPELADRPINEVAYRCGFNDMSHFSYSFRRRFGCSPRQHRAAQQRAVPVE
jgi:AraC-like DNA-binding protein